MRLALALSTALALLSGCSFFSGTTSRVERAVVDEVRSIGGVIAETTTERHWDGQTPVTNVLVTDMRSTDSRTALEKAIALLKAFGWTIEMRRLPDWVSMRSDRWKDTQLSLIRIASYQFDEFEDPELAKMITAVRTRGETEGVVVLELDRADRS